MECRLTHSYNTRISDEGSDAGVKFNGIQLDNLRFADDIGLLADTKDSQQDMAKRLAYSKRMGYLQEKQNLFSEENNIMNCK